MIEKLNLTNATFRHAYTGLDHTSGSRWVAGIPDHDSYLGQVMGHQCVIKACRSGSKNAFVLPV